MIFIHAGTVSFEAAYLLSFLTSFSLRISIFGHMDDPAGGPVGRVFPELAFLVPAFRNDDFTGERLSDYPDGVPDFRLFKFLAEWIRQQDVLPIEFSEGWDLVNVRIQEYV